MDIYYKKIEYAKKDLNFIKEIKRDLDKNGYQIGGNAYTMLRDWINELKKVKKIFFIRKYIKNRHKKIIIRKRKIIHFNLNEKSALKN